LANVGNIKRNIETSEGNNLLEAVILSIKKINFIMDSGQNLQENTARNGRQISMHKFKKSQTFFVQNHFKAGYREGFR
jgi:hypothetical protein